MALVEIQNLSVEFQTARGTLRAVDQLDMTVEQGEVLGVVGESGSGKSVSMLALMGLIPWPGKVTADRLSFAGHDLLSMSAAQRRRIIGKDIAMIFQEPMTSLNPTLTIGFQIAEVLRLHRGMSKSAALDEAVRLLAAVGVGAARRRLAQYPHQLSGGLRQRAMIAIALACEPPLVIADEPTTALDVTIQAEILELLADLRARYHMALLLITHDLGVVAEAVDRVAVMHAGRIVEQGPVRQVFHAPQHPYTRGLLASIPGLADA